MADIFISYSRKDGAYAEVLASLIQRRGLTVWWDVEMMPADRYREKIVDELNKSYVTVVLWSEHSRDSAWVPDEANIAFKAEKLVQVSLDGQPQPIGFGSASINYIDLSNWNSNDSSTFDGKLLDVLESYIPAKEKLDALKHRILKLETGLNSAKSASSRKVRNLLSIGGGIVGVALLLSSLSLLKLNQLNHSVQEIQNQNSFNFLNSNEYSELWNGGEAAGTNRTELAGLIPADAKGVILNVIVKSESGAGSFVCAGPDGKFNTEGWHYNNISVTNYDEIWSGGLVICPINSSRELIWRMFDNSSKTTGSKQVISIATLIGWL